MKFRCRKMRPEGAAEVRQLASGLIEVTGARFRATERGYTAVAAQLAFGYRGEAENGEPLEGGEFRIQIGQKLLSADPCNLVYVIWRLYPTESIVVSLLSAIRKNTPPRNAGTGDTPTSCPVSSSGSHDREPNRARGTFCTHGRHAPARVHVR